MCYQNPLRWLSARCAPQQNVRATRRSDFIDANVALVISHFGLPKAFFEGLKTMLFKALWGPPGLCIATVIISDTIIIESTVTSQCQIEVWKLCEVMRGHKWLQKHFLASKSQIQRKMVEISIESPPFKTRFSKIWMEQVLITVVFSSVITVIYVLSKPIAMTLL